MTKHFLPNPAFRAASAGLDLPIGLIRRMVGPPITIDGQELDPHVQYLLMLGNRTPLVTMAAAPGTSLRVRREINADGARIAMVRAKGVTTQDRTIPGPAGRIPIRIYRADGVGSDPPIVLYFHGGGFAIGGIDTHEGAARMLARITRTVVVSVGYRLAPEHPHPAAVDDCLATYDWLIANGTRFGARRGKVAVMGDSAGGNLAAVVSAIVRGRGTSPGPIAQGLVYPATDLRMTAPSHDLFANGFFLTEEEMRRFRGQYAPQPEQWHDPTVSPLLAARFDGLPATRIWTAGFDPLRDEAEQYSQRLAEAGVSTTLRREPTMIHGFFSMGVLPGGLRRIASLCRDMADLVWQHAGQ